MIGSSSLSCHVNPLTIVISSFDQHTLSSMFIMIEYLQKVSVFLCPSLHLDLSKTLPLAGWGGTRRGLLLLLPKED
uniref:Ovule protein n=1 Tax=Caenorhabditis tropicalis TaxID=1561998 RepID=A0A1I7TT14_9PELO